MHLLTKELVCHRRSFGLHGQQYFFLFCRIAVLRQSNLSAGPPVPAEVVADKVPYCLPGAISKDGQNIWQSIGGQSRYSLGTRRLCGTRLDG